MLLALHLPSFGRVAEGAWGRTRLWITFGRVRVRYHRQMPKVSASKLDRWRTLDAVDVLSRLAEHAKGDISFVARKDPTTSRWHSSVGGQDFELLFTGPKFWDCRANTGGGGAVDLVMHLKGIDFKEAAALLVQLGI